jgi:MYXO-CTERM domain-containing protein
VEVLALTVVLAVGLAPGASAAGGRAGNAVPTDPATNAAVRSGGPSTPWTFSLPSGAACSGDTATHAFHVYSFIVPSNIDVGTLIFNPSTGPSQGLPLVDITGSAYLAANTAAVTGQVVQIPTFDFKMFATTDQGGTKVPLPPGEYKGGLACANTLGQVDKYWDGTFNFTASSSNPNGEVWANSTPSNSSGGNSPALPLAAAALVGVGFVMYRRRRQRRTASAV